VTIRVLHIFAPSLKTRFGGQYITWKYNFNNWDDPSIEHIVLDTDRNQLVPAMRAFDFEYPPEQNASSRWTRFTWIFKLLIKLIQHKGQYNLIHFHVLWWGSLLAANWARANEISCISESVLLDADTPGHIRQERFGKLKVRLLKKFTNILVISDFLAKDFHQHGFPNQQIFNLMNSVDTTLFHPIDSLKDKAELRVHYGLPQNAFIILFVGSVIKRKGVDLLIHAFILAAHHHPDLHLLIIGPCSADQNPSLDENFIQSLHKLVASSGFLDKINFLGIVKDRQILAELYLAADGFVFPSRREGLGNVVLEAMASGLPLITSDLPVLKQVIKDEDNGLVVPMDDVQALAAAIDRILQNPTLRVKLSKQARDYVLEHHSFQAWQSEIAGFYKKLCNKNQG